MHTLDKRMEALAESWDWQGQAELMQEELKRHGIENTYIEILGGGAYGVTIPIPNLGYWALLTADYGLGIYPHNLGHEDELIDSIQFDSHIEFLTLSQKLSLVSMALHYYLATKKEA